MITQKELKELLYYNPDTGIFTWVVDRVRARAGAIAGTKATTGYIKITINSKQYIAHRLVWLYCFGEWPINNIDHINRIKDDNRLDNLRDVTCRENNSNTCRTKTIIGAKPNHNKGSKYPWYSSIKYKNNTIHLGMFLTAIEAGNVYQLALENILMGIHPQETKAKE